MNVKVVILILFIFLALIGPENLAATKRALLIGIQDYKNSGLKSLEAPHNDLQLIKQVLINKFQFQEQDITCLKDRQATHTRLEKAFASLAGKINKGDFVYIHYCGHGSQTLDLNGDEHPREYDQTWVTYGSRTITAKGNDKYDILDDELYEWLVPIFAKTSHVVLVSDSCHSASVTRGNAPTVRAASIDKRQYPFGKKMYRFKAFKHGIRIGAAEDTGLACELPIDNGKIHGLFTWYWAGALQQAQPGDTWNDLFKRTYINVTNRLNSQQPQIQGKIEEEVFGGNFKKTSPRIPISEIWNNGKHVRIEVGGLSGVTVGSIYRLYNSREKEKSKLPTIEITRVRAFYSYASAKGTFRPGDLVIEEMHSYNFEPIPVFINADDPGGEDKAVVNRLRNLFTGKSSQISGYHLSKNQQTCEFVLYVLRPKKDNGKFIKKGVAPPTHSRSARCRSFGDVISKVCKKNKVSEGIIKKNPNNTLPKSFPGRPPEIWILNSAEQPIYNNLRISFHDPGIGTALLVENLKKITRLKEIIRLTSRTKINIELNTILWTPVEKPGKNKDNYFELPGNARWFLKQRIHTFAEMEKRRSCPFANLLTFSLKNNTDTDYYIYLLDVMSNGNIRAIFPSHGDRQQDALLPRGKLWDLKGKVALILDEPGKETIKLLFTEIPIDIALLEQEEFKCRGGEKAGMNPLERLLTTALHGIRSRRIRISLAQWGTQQYSFFVKNKETK